MAVVRTKLDNYQVYHTSGAGLEVFAELLAGSLPLVRIRQSRKGRQLVHRADWVGKRYILKRQTTRGWFDALRRLWEGSLAVNLLRAVDKARGEGFAATPAIHLAAERRTGWKSWESWLVMDFVEGEKPAGELPGDAAGREALAGEVRELLTEAHRHGLISGDLNGGNFIRSPAGLMIIDLSGHRPGRFARAKDQVLFEWRFAQPFPPHNFRYWLTRVSMRILRLRRTLVGR